MLEAHQVRKRWGPIQALDGFSLTIEAGEICGLLGHNGAGKTTFARICAGLERADGGDVWIDGYDVARQAGHARARLGLAPQEIALYPTVTLRQNLGFYGGLAGLRGARLRREIDEVAEAVLLTEALGRTVEKLSGGQQRRAQAATALLCRPSVLLMDEPTVGADPVTRHALLKLVRSRADYGATVCYTTHYLPELEALDATLAIAQAGRVIARGRRQELLRGLPGRVVLTFNSPPPPALAALAALATRASTSAAGNELHFSTDRPAETVARLLGDLGSRADSVTGVEIREPSLDDLYQHLTGVASADGAAPAEQPQESDSHV